MKGFYMGWGYWGGFPPYVSKAEKMRRPRNQKRPWQKKELNWNQFKYGVGKFHGPGGGRHGLRTLNVMPDYDNRVPRGRTYVRSGAVLDLKIAPNTITAHGIGQSIKTLRNQNRDIIA